MRKTGYTLIEVSVSMALLSIISLLGFVTLKSSTESAALAQAKAEVQASLRDVMGALTSELRAAYTQRSVNHGLAPEEAASIEIDEDAQSVTFMVPVPGGPPDLVTNSTPITFRWEYEDTVNSNGMLDEGEDANQDDMLTRRITRQQGDTVAVLGGANEISGANFTLEANLQANNDDLTTIRIWLAASKRYGPGLKHIVHAQLESRVDLAN